MSDMHRNSHDLTPQGKLPKSSTGLDANLAGLLAYLFGVVTGLIFYLLEKDSKFVRFHALQSILFSVVLLVLNTVLSFIPIIGWLVGFLISIAGFVLWIVLMVKAFKGEIYKLPKIGAYAEKQVFGE